MANDHVDIFDRELNYVFHTKQEGNDFLKRLRDIAYKCDVVTVNDILKDRGLGLSSGGYQYGYHKKMLKKVAPERIGSFWQVVLPVPGKMVRDIHGYWTVDKVKELEAINAEGG